MRLTTLIALPERVKMCYRRCKSNLGDATGAANDNIFSGYNKLLDLFSL